MSRMDSNPKWINPCGLSEEVQGPSSDVNVTEEEMLSTIVNQANVAIHKAHSFEDEFVRKTFNMRKDQLHSKFKDYHYKWLPSVEEIPKELGRGLSIDHLRELELDETLLSTYEQLQKVAVGLEQTVWDQHDQHEAFESHFKDAEHNLKLVLCELQMTIIEHNLTPRPDITRDIMTEEFRTMDNTSTNIRNWLVYRDYMNVLEYIIEVFTYLKENLKKSSP